MMEKFSLYIYQLLSTNLHLFLKRFCQQGEQKSPGTGQCLFSAFPVSVPAELLFLGEYTKNSLGVNIKSITARWKKKRAFSQTILLFKVICFWTLITISVLTETHWKFLLQANDQTCFSLFTWVSKRYLMNINSGSSSDLDSHGFKFNGNFQQVYSYLNKRHGKITSHICLS